VAHRLVPMRRFGPFVGDSKESCAPDAWKATLMSSDVLKVAFLTSGYGSALTMTQSQDVGRVCDGAGSGV
jgi:hypothetical protein